MAKRSSAYWKKRFLEIEKASNAYGVDAFRQIEPSFDSAQRQIQREIESWYARYAKNNNISMQEARRQLSTKELKEFRWDVNEYIKYGRENALNGQWMKELENASARVHVSRLEALKIRTQHAAEVAFGNELDMLDGMARKVFTEDYYKSIFTVHQGFGLGWNIGQVDERKLNTLIAKPWTADNKTFKDRIWNSKTAMVSELHQQMTRMCLLGKAPDEAINAMTKFVDKKFKNAKYVAGRLVMTEQAYFHSVAQKSAFEDLDVEEFEVVATLDNHTSEICQDLDGQHFPMKDYEPGVTAPPFHVWCRSVTVPYFEDNYTGERVARNEEGQTYYVPDSMTYKDWKQSLVDGNGEGLEVAKPIKIEVPSVEKANKIATSAIVEQHKHRVDDTGLNYVPYSQMSENDKKNLGADFTGMDAKLAETTAIQFKALSSEYESMCQRIEVVKFDPTRGSVPASTSPQMHTQTAKMSFNKNIVGNYDGFTKRMQNAIDRGQFSKISVEQRDKYVITHEFAHTLMDFETPLKNYVGAETSHMRKARKEIKAIREEYQERVRALTAAQRQAELKAITTFDEKDWAKAKELNDELKKVTISKYASVSVDEFMAEAFVDAKIGSDPSEYSKQVLEVIDKYFKKKR